MSDYNTVKVNPSCPIIKLQVGDLDLTMENSPEMAKYLFGFSMNRSSEDSANDCVFRLFDETALLLEFAILQGYKDVKFQYGMDESNLSKQYSAIVKDYNIEFTGAGNIIMDLQVSIGADTSSDISAEYSNNPGEAFKTVCEEEGWEVGEFTETKDTEKEALLRTAQTATDFIKDVLIPDAVSTDDKNDYYFWTDSQDGKTIANFTPKGDFTEASDYKVYEIVIGGGNGNEGLQCEDIISFEPSFNGLFYNFFNESGTGGTGGTGGTSGGAGNGDSNVGSFTWPTPGTTTISSDFGPRTAPTAGASTYHRGVDIPVPTGTNVLSAASGTVLQVGYQSARGNYVFIDHGNGVATLYQHLQNATVKVGDKVTAGQVIAKSGSSGIGTGPHLHLEVHVGHKGTINSSNAVNPENYFSLGTSSTSTYSLRNTRTNLSYGATVSGWASRDCGLYEGTSRETNMLAQVPKGAEVILSGETPMWYRVEYGGKKGYILKASITTDDPDGNNAENDMPITDAILNQKTTIDQQNTVINAISNGGLSNPAYVLEVPTLESLTNEVLNPYVDNGIIRRVGASNYTSEEMGRVAQYMWTRAQALANTAQLTLRGDASFTTMSFVAIVVLTPDGFFHHSSGLYQVLEISDDIDGGEYTTTLNLLKLGLNVNEDGSISVRDPSQVLFPTGIGDNGSTNNNGSDGNSSLGSGGTVDQSALKSICDQYNGCAYSQANRTGPNSYDCSSLVNAIMGDLGVKVNWSTTAQGVQKVGNGEWGQVIWSSKSGQTLTADMIPPGAIFIYNNGSSGHTGIFVDSNTVFHASTPSKGVLYTSGSYYVNYLNNYSGNAYVVIPPQSTGSPLENNGINSRIN